jgi:hypothetical protein
LRELRCWRFAVGSSCKWKSTVCTGMARPSIVQVDTSEHRNGKYDRPRYSHCQWLQAFSRFLYQGSEATWDHKLYGVRRQRRTPRLKGFGDGKRFFFWLKEGKPDPQAVHVGFVAKDHSEVDAFYKAALAAGGKSKESPQARLEYHPGYYATWVFDPDGHDIEVVNKS